MFIEGGTKQQAIDVLNKYFGYSSFRKGQQQVIDAILAKQDVVAIMPTGGGKSICYQVPAMLMDGITIVISPLISLMKDQVDTVTELGIEAAYINSSLSNLEIEDIFSRTLDNKLKLLYVAPERLESLQFLDLISRVKVGLVAIDEAHCVSQWGHDFRTSYRSIKRFVRLLNNRPVLAAFTATATEEVRGDIVSLLGLQDPEIFISGFDRENLKISIVKGVTKKPYILDYIKENAESAGIIYAATRKEVDSLYEYIISKGISATRYHAGLTDEERSKNQEDFVYDRINVMIATNAFGMGIDKPNIRYVFHYNMPKNIEGYYQEIGRAGRDGAESQCILLFSPGDIHTQKYIIDIGTNSEERKINEYKKLQGMTDLVYTNDCYRKYILNYFGEEYDKECNNCSNCELEGELIDKTVDAQKVLSCVYRMKKGYGTTILIDVLRGSENKKVKELGFNELSTYGIMKNYSKDGLKNFISTLVSHRLLNYEEGEYPIVRLNDISIKVLKGEQKVLFKELKKNKKISEDNELFEILRTLRREIASKEGVPPYIIFGDTTLREMGSRFPKTLEQMGDISGVGEQKLKKYGEDFLKEIISYVSEKNIQVEWDYRKKESKSKKDNEDISNSTDNLREDEKKKSHIITIELLKEYNCLNKVIEQRGLALGTICNHIEQYIGEGNLIDFALDFTSYFNEEQEIAVLGVADEVGYDKLKPIKERLSQDIGYESIKLILLKAKCKL